MKYRTIQPNFSRGEIAPDLYGRFDVDAYNAGLKQARNVVVLKYGGLTKRPGTRYVGESFNGLEPSRLIPFQFSLDQSYALELGQGFMAPCALGGRVVEEELAITAITSETQAKVTAAYHGYAVGVPVYITGIAGAMGDLLNYRVHVVVEVVDDGNFRIDADTTDVAFTAASGGITRTAEPDPLPDPPVVPDPVDPPAPPDIRIPGSGGEVEPY